MLNKFKSLVAAARVSLHQGIARDPLRVMLLYILQGWDVARTLDPSKGRADRLFNAWLRICTSAGAMVGATAGRVFSLAAYAAVFITAVLLLLGALLRAVLPTIF